MTVWTIAWWTEVEQARAAGAVREALRDWAVQWGGDTLAIRVEASPLPDSGVAGAWQCVTGGGDRDGVWVTHPDTAASVLAAALCDDEGDGSAVTRHGSTLSLAVAREAARALDEALCQHFDWSASVDAPCVLPDGAERGGLGLSVHVGFATPLRIVLSAGVARAVAGRAPAAPQASLAGLQDVVGRRRITLNVDLRPVRLEIGSLCSLTIGDVVALDHKLDEPVTLYAEDASPVAEAHLSKIGSQKAIRLNRAAS
ncbi:flagellar motor switch/type III secretory pathway protein FliN [Achromobacter deleyi]|uniref:FliM/FliN family flagellar motor switch protein n=1 Tax=Achromobacter deleyi TaxID=1353891 RepID=UPI00286176CA|nr:FliM/FliN family flagellar motor C-terminal domain-containing protein [Achromobacter deleyi]MDR6602105.1 flagellar motor switch/type III secretory pathway protein FliN [Achromobacter deleyi]